MPKLRRLSGKEVLAILKRLGFEIVRIKGSHHHMRHTQSQSCFLTIPVHGNKSLPPGTMKDIIKQVAPCITDIELKTNFYTP
jgi:predicted RNA binding protein YcfA (HicA-like mRNA interferase family)